MMNPDEEMSGIAQDEPAHLGVNEIFRIVEKLSLEDRIALILMIDETLPLGLQPQADRDRIPGLNQYLGTSWMSDDFNDPLDDSDWWINQPEDQT